MILFIIIIITLLFTTLIVIYNFITAPLLENNAVSESKLVSILIPARNEDQNISECLEKVLSQTYRNYEVLILDDESTDKTKIIAEEFCKRDGRVKLLRGKSLPGKWTGKNWACHQLSENAKGDFFLFMDADVYITDNTLIKAIGTLVSKDAALLSLFPTQKLKSLGEFLVVPLMNWLLLTFLPLKFVYNSKNVSFSAANGQFMLWKKEIYEEIRGHKAVQDRIVEDIELSRLVKKKGYKVLTGLGNKNVYCRMYNSLIEGINGFSKNFYPGFNIHPFIFLSMVLILFIIYISPVYLMFYKEEFVLPAVLIFFQRLLISLKSRQNYFLNIILHPVQMIILFFTGINSVKSSSERKITWKGRNL